MSKTSPLARVRVVATRDHFCTSIASSLVQDIAGQSPYSKWSWPLTRHICSDAPSTFITVGHMVVSRSAISRFPPFNTVGRYRGEISNHIYCNFSFLLTPMAAPLAWCMLVAVSASIHSLAEERSCHDLPTWPRLNLLPDYHNGSKSLCRGKGIADGCQAGSALVPLGWGKSRYANPCFVYDVTGHRRRQSTILM